MKNLPAIEETWVQFLGREHPLEKEIATHSSNLALGSTPGSGKSPGGGHSHPLQHPCLGSPCGSSDATQGSRESPFGMPPKLRLPGEMPTSCMACVPASPFPAPALVQTSLPSIPRAFSALTWWMICPPLLFHPSGILSFSCAVLPLTTWRFL